MIPFWDTPLSQEPPLARCGQAGYRRRAAGRGVPGPFAADSVDWMTSPGLGSRAIAPSFRFLTRGRPTVTDPRRFFLLALCALLVSPASSRAKSGGGEERHLDGHGFLPSFYVLDPFVDTRFDTTVGAATAVGFSTELFDLDGSPLATVEGDLLFATLGMRYQARIGSRFALGLGASAQLRAGQSAYAFLAEGADVQNDLHAWGTWRLHRGPRDQVSVGLDWSSVGTLLFTPDEFAQDIADGASLRDASLVRDEQLWTSHVTSSWAHAFSPTYGLRASAEFGVYEDPRASSTLKAHHRLGILGEVDFQHLRGGVPIGIAAGYTQNLPDGDPYAGPAGFLFGIWYTGRDEFSVGLEMGFLKVPVLEQETSELDATSGLFSMRYSF